MKLQLYVIRHPNMEKGFILSSKDKINNFIEKNEKTWKKYNLDPKLFIVELYSVKDNKLEAALLETLPELFL